MSMRTVVLVSTAFAVSTLAAPSHAAAQPVLPKQELTVRPELRIVGSTSLEPMVGVLTEQLVRKHKLNPPDVRLTGSVAGMALFCAGLGPEHPDITVATRRMTKIEYDRCQKAGILDIVELEVGHGGLVAVVKPSDPIYDFSSRLAYLGLAAEVPEIESADDFRPNPFRRWRQVHPRLPDVEIKVFGPSKDAGSRAVLEAVALENGCRRLKAIGMIFSADQRFRQCTTIRSDGVYVDVPEPFANAAVERMLAAPPGAIAITTYASYRRYADKVVALSISGVRPEAKSFHDNSYDWESGFYAYFKRGHMRDKLGHGVVRGLREFMEEVLSDDAAGANGYLTKVGMISLDPPDRAEQLVKARRLERYAR